MCKLNTNFPWNTICQMADWTAHCSNESYGLQNHDSQMSEMQVGQGSYGRPRYGLGKPKMFKREPHEFLDRCFIFRFNDLMERAERSFTRLPTRCLTSADQALSGQRMQGGTITYTFTMMTIQEINKSHRYGKSVKIKIHRV